MSLTAEIQIEIPFHDVDAMQVVWHGHYIKYFEAVRGALLRTFNYDYPDMEESGYLWPVIECKSRYISPAKYGMCVKAAATLKEWENRLLIEYLLTDTDTGRKICKGHTVQVAVNKKNGEMCLASPPVILKKIEAALA